MVLNNEIFYTKTYAKKCLLWKCCSEELDMNEDLEAWLAVAGCLDFAPRIAVKVRSTVDGYIM